MHADCAAIRTPTYVCHACFPLAGEEGLERPGTAQPSSICATGGGSVPDEVVQLARLHSGHEGGVRPGSAVPSSLRPSAQGAPVPLDVVQHASQYLGEPPVGGSWFASAKATRLQAAGNVLQRCPAQHRLSGNALAGLTCSRQWATSIRAGGSKQANKPLQLVTPPHEAVCTPPALISGSLCHGIRPTH